MLKKSLSKKPKQKRANANLHKSQTKSISCFIYTCYRKKDVVEQRKSGSGQIATHHIH